MLQIALKSRFKSDLRRRLLAWECFLCSSFHSCFGLFIFFFLQLAGVVPPTEMRTLKQSFCCGNLMRTILRDIFLLLKSANIDKVFPFLLIAWGDAKIPPYSKITILKLTGHANSKGKRMRLTESLFAWLYGDLVRLKLFSPRTGVTTSPKVHGDVRSILAW